MTVVVAAPTPDGIVMATDSLTTDGQLALYSASSKLAVSGPYTYGMAGSKRVAQVIRYATAWPDPDTTVLKTTGDVEAFLVTRVVPAIQQACADAAVLETESGVHRFDAELLLVVANTIAAIDGEGCVHIERAGRWAIGSGAQIALGSLGDHGPWDSHDVAEAARLAIRQTIGCGGGIDLCTIPAVPDIQPATS